MIHAENERFSSLMLRGVALALTEQMVFWSPEMISIAIVTRDEKEVFRHHPKAWRTAQNWARNSNIYDMTTKITRSATRFEHVFSHERCGYDEVALGETFLFSAFVDFAGKWRKFPALGDWFPELQEALCHGEITACGFNTQTQSTEIIQPLEWHNATFRAAHGSKRTQLHVGENPPHSNITFYPSEFIKNYIPTIKIPNRTNKKIVQSKVKEYIPWLGDLDKQKLTNRQQVFFDIINRMFEEQGLPVFWNNKIRYEVLLPILGREVSDKWEEGDSEAFDRWILDAERQLCPPTAKRSGRPKRNL